MEQLGFPDIQQAENLRTVFQLAHERNENIVNLIRATDGAICGFLGLTVIELFKDGVDLKSLTVPFFCGILIVSMFLWRNRVNAYQRDIVKGYNRMVNCEYFLDVPYRMTIRKNIEEDIQKNSDIITKPKNFDDLCEYLKPENYKHPEHDKANCWACVFEGLGILIFIFWFCQWIT